VLGRAVRLAHVAVERRRLEVGLAERRVGLERELVVLERELLLAGLDVGTSL
jgi:hypothetical protein